ncbi:MAG: hypothetical protein GF308_17985 [Candidatus Heimdallarchaeota archaeon]|nr:hypothetical protein [Candidatus Heimdallarchaeota archaeon]
MIVALIKLEELVETIDEQIFLIVGPTGSGKVEFAMQYILDGLQTDNAGIILATDRFPNEYIKIMTRLGTDPQQFINSKQLQFIDAVSYRTGERPSKGTTAVNNIRDLTGMSIFFKKLSDKCEKLQLLIDTVSTLSIFNSDIALLDFIQTQVSRLKQKNHSGMIIAHEGIMEERVIQGISSLVDSFIEFKLEEDQTGALKRKIRVAYAKGIKLEGWVNVER